MSIRLPAPAKLNLCLNITGRRPDGYHELQTAIQFIDLCDELVFEPADEVVVECNGLDLPMADNLVYRAALALRQHTGTSQGVRVSVEKHIPSGGGLGGGSSDAATTLLALNRAWQLALSPDELAAIGLTLGTDIPVFVRGRASWAEGIGEQLQAVDFVEKYYVVVHPGVTVPTAAIYADPHLTRNGSPITIARFLRQGAGNACESVVRRRYPDVDQAANWLTGWGSVSMSGTGACLFLPVDTEEEALEIKRAAPGSWSVYLTRSMNLSPLLAAVDQEFGASPSW